MEQKTQSDMSTLKEKLAKGSDRKPKRNQFLNSLYNALSKKEYADALCWDADGKAFILQNPEVIADKILVEEFSGMKFTSFIRQLSYYGFKRVSRRSNVRVYCHEQFQREKKDCLKKIKRNHKDLESDKIVEEKTAASKKDQEATPTASDDVMAEMQKKIDYLQAELEKMRSENLALRSCIRNMSNIVEPNIAASEDEYAQDSFPKVSSENQPTGFYQTFFNPQINQIRANPDVDGNDVMYPSNQITFIEAYQPDCRLQHPNLMERPPVGIQDSNQCYPSFPNYYEDKNALDCKNPEENYWRSQGFTENDFSKLF